MSGRHRRASRSRATVAAAVAAALLIIAAVAFAVIRSRTGPPSPPIAASGRSTSASTSPTPSPLPKQDGNAPKERDERRGKLVIHATGDVNLDPNYISTYRSEGYGYAWSGLDGLFKDDSLTIVNLECSVATGGVPNPKDFVFQGDPDALPFMRKAGVEVANMGNNHSQDYGKDAMLETRENLIDERIAPVGAGKDAKEANEPAMFTIDGWKVAVLGFGGVYPSLDWFATQNNPGMANGDDIDSMVKAVKRADRKADLVIVMIHWGVELQTKPEPEDVERGHAMVDAGADMIFGGHAHRLQPMEMYRGKPIFWSLGNFVWPNHGGEGSVTGVAEVTVSKGGDEKARLLPATIVDHGHPVLR
ncbi:MAG: CapA family protein [Actinomycetota bacterium]